MKDVLVSVIMPVYNAERFLNESIESILFQSYSNFEFILINDGSTDQSKDIILSYKDSRIKLINNINNLGLNKSLNIGIKNCNGKYLFRMDSDDISHTSRIFEQVKFMENNPEYVLCGTNFDIIDSKSNIVSFSKNLQNQFNDDIKSLIFFSCPFVHPSICIRNSIISSHKLFYNESIKQAEDYVLYVDLLTAGSFYNLNSTLLMYRVHESENRITNVKNYKDIFLGRKLAWNKILDHLEIDYPPEYIYILHDKLTYSPETLYQNEILLLNQYFYFLKSLSLKNKKVNFFNIHFFNKNISNRLYSSLLLSIIPKIVKLKLYLSFFNLMNLKQNLKFIFKFLLKLFQP